MRSRLAFAAACASVAVASPLDTRQSANRSPCGQLQDLQAASLRDSPDDTPRAQAALVLECLQSIPFDVKQSVALLDSLKPNLEFHSTFPWIKDPPKEYAENVRPSYDFWAAFNKLRTDAAAGTFTNEYDFSYSLAKTFSDAKDPHLQAMNDVLSNQFFDFFRPFALVAISKDGKGIPKVYERNDIVVPVDYTPSEILKINGQDTVAYVEHWAEDAAFSDKDAAWNEVFYTPAKESINFRGGTRGSFRDPLNYPGPSTTLTFANGTEVTRPNFAYLAVDLTGINNGQDLRDKMLSPPVKTAAELASTWTTGSESAVYTSGDSPPAPGYPQPVVRHRYNMNGGYFINGSGFDDVAILSIPSFAGGDDGNLDFQNVTTEFLRLSVKANKKKLILDLTGGLSGSFGAGYDVFKQLFPDLEPKDPLRARASKALDLIGREITAYLGPKPPTSVDELNKRNDTTRFLVLNTTNMVNTVDAEGKKFKTWTDLFHGPTIKGEKLTDIFGFDLNFSGGFAGEVQVSGYGSRSKAPPSPFAAKDTVIITDGRCTGACTVPFKLLREQVGIKVITIGGRPNTNLIQALGGSRGHSSLNLADALWQAVAPLALETLHSASYYAQTALGKFNDLAYHRVVHGSVNDMNTYRGDDLETPWQFKLEMADCRMFWTGPMLADMTNLWKAVAETAFLGKSHCVAGAL